MKFEELKINVQAFQEGPKITNVVMENERLKRELEEAKGELQNA